MMTANLRVLYSFPHPVGAPGIGTTALNQVRALAMAGAEVTLVCTSLHDKVPRGVEVRETLRFLGRRVPHRAFGRPDRAMAYHDQRVARLLRVAPERFDVVHVWPQSAVATLAAARAVGCMSAREVPNTHTANAYEQAACETRIVGVELRQGHSHRPDPRRLRVEEKEYAESDILMVPSDHVAQTFIDRGVNEARLGRHQYGYDPTQFSAHGRVEWPTRRFTATFVGSGEPRKGLHYALEAWAAADTPEGSMLVIAGVLAPRYRQYIAPWLAHPTVEYLGFVDDVPDLLRRSDILLLPSVEEGSALVTYEAQACGCIPIVSSASGALLPRGLADFIHKPRDVKALTAHLTTISQDHHLRESLRDEVFNWSTKLTWESAGIRMLEIYKRGLSARAASAIRRG